MAGEYSICGNCGGEYLDEKICNNCFKCEDCCRCAQDSEDEDFE